MRKWRCVVAATLIPWGASAQAAWYRADFQALHYLRR